jgi:hypothetical protein
MRSIFLLVLILLLVKPLQAQNQFLEKNKIYSYAKIYQKGMPAVKVKNLILSNDSLLQYTLNDYQGSSHKILLSTTNVRYISVIKGSHVASYGAYGGAVGLISSLYAVFDPTLKDSGVNWTPFILGFTAGGAVIGALVGVCVPKWKILFIPAKRTSYSLGITPVVNRIYYGAGLRLCF